MSNASITTALVGHLKDPMRRSAYALILGTGLTSGLGFVFWIVAARWLPPATVGIGAALVSAMTLLATVSTLGLRNGLIRFLPTAGAASRRLALSAYGVCAVTAMLAALAFVAGQPLWASKLAFLRSGPLSVLFFVAGTVVWVIFILQDNVLVGLRRTAWVPVENGLCSLAKIGLLPLLAFTAQWAIFAASVLPAAAAVFVVTIALLRVSGRINVADGEPVRVPALVRFAAAEHFSAILWMGTTDLITLLVLNQAGSEEAAYYYMASTIGYAVLLVTSNIGSALVAEGARYPERTVPLARQAFLHAARLVIPLVAIGIVLTPLGLQLIGPDYAEHGSTALRLLLASAVPQILVGISVSVARIRRDLRTITSVYTALAVGAISGSALLLRPLGLTGVGLAFLCTQLAVAITLLLTGRSGLWPNDSRWRHAITQFKGLPLALRRHGNRRTARRTLPAAFNALGLPRTASWRLLPSDFDTLVVAIDHPEPTLVLKIATSDASSHGLDRHAEMTADLHAEKLPSGLSRLAPKPLRRGLVEGYSALLESRLPGVVATDTGATGIAAEALSAISELHEATARQTRVDSELLRDWIDKPISQLRLAAGQGRYDNGLNQLADMLNEALIGRSLTTSVVHGDFWPGNVLVESTDVGPELTGIVDWENAKRVGLPDADVVHWWLSEQPGELGSTVRHALIDTAWAERELSGLPVSLPNPQLAIGSLVLLTWLWHCSAGIARVNRHRVSRVWLSRNVWPILDLVDRPTSSRAAVRMGQ